MNLDSETMDQRRARLAADIARQRGELTTAYRNLSTPIHYTEQAMRGFGFLRQNPWVLSVVPACFTIGSALWGLKKGTSEKPSRLTRAERARLAELERARASKGFAGKLLKYGGHGLKLFKLYRRLRPFFG